MFFKNDLDFTNIYLKLRKKQNYRQFSKRFYEKKQNKINSANCLNFKPIMR